MKRFVLFIILFALLTLWAAWLANAAAISVKNSKHNLSYDLSSTGTGSIKSVATGIGGTSEVCVFCHTPHGGNTAAPLWNKSASVASYSTYTSDVLAGLGYWAAEDPKTGVPHVKTRICLSCHDGTIALGSLVNMPYGAATQIPMEGTTGAVVQYGMPPTAAGYIGVELKDDHPVAIKHDNNRDSELTASIPALSSIWLYDGTAAKTKAGLGTGYVECTSCHDPHNSEFGNFLVEKNDGSALCLRCHDKTGFAISIHNTAGAAYSPPTGGTPATLGATVGGVKCMSCHFPHKASGSGTPGNFSANANAGFGKYLLSFQEEKSCYNNSDRWGQTTAPCHGNNAAAQKNIVDLVASTKPSRHNVDMNTTSSLHEATEARSAGWLVPGNTNWHVECADCHNPHTAGSTSHTTRPPVPVVGPVPPALANTSSLYGTGGVSVSVAPTWAGGQGTYSYLEPKGVVDMARTAPGVSYEYQICLKCHSEFAWRNSTAPNSPSFSPAAAMTDQAKEFMNTGVGNSFHPVAAVTGRVVGTLVTAPVNWQANRGNQTMYCSDCHNNNAAPPQGPHGSGENFILVAKFTDMYSARGGGDAQKQPNGDLCFVCHDQNTYSQTTNLLNGGTNFTAAPGGLNLHAMHAYRVVNPTIGGLNPWPYRCVNCHARVPHGFNKLAMIVQTSTDAAPYVADGTSLGLGGGKINNFAINSQNYVIGSCATANGCHQAGL